MRVKGGPRVKNRRKKILNQAEGFTGRGNSCHIIAKRLLERGMAYQFRDRKANKRNFRRLWITRITAAVRARGVSYSVFMGALKQKNIEVNRKMLADLAATDARSFDSLVKAAGF